MTALRKPRASESQIVAAIVTAIDALGFDDLNRLGGWQALAELSTRTEFEAIGADEASVVLDGDRFEAIAEIYVLLNYGSGDEEESLSDSYIATIHGSVHDEIVTIDAVVSDTSPFYS